jgi:predicted RNase H-like HicB family nuclease
MATIFPVVVEREDSGAFSAYVVGLPVYAQGATAARVERALQKTLAAYVAAHRQLPKPKVHVKVVSITMPKLVGVDMTDMTKMVKRPIVTLKSVAALIGGKTSARKAAAARANGRLGGRPRIARGERHDY